MNLSILVLAISLITTNVHAYEDEDSVMNFDEIVSQLSQPNTSKYQFSRTGKDPFENVLIHGGVSFISSSITMGGYGIENMSAFHKGVEASMGIDLFSKNWSAEGAVRSFGPQSSNNTEYRLKEFDIKIIYRNHLAYKSKWKLGFGVSSRYLTVKSLPQNNIDEVILMNSAPKATEQKFTTPASILSIGTEGYVTDTISIGVEIAYRNSLIEETADISSLEAAFKVEGHF